MEPFPVLPAELVFLIIETLLEIAPKRVLDLASLSRGIQPIVERAIYRCIILDRQQRTESFSAMLRLGCRPASFYRNHVQTLCIAEQLTVHKLLPIFSSCSSLETLAIFIWNDEGSTVTGLDASLDVLAASGPRPSKLCCDLRWALHPQNHPEIHRFNLPLFQNVTHLELYSYENFLAFDTKHLHAFTNLTHLSLTMLDTPKLESFLRLLGQQLSLADSIVMVCIIFTDFLDRDSFEQIRLLSKDPRVVFCLYPGSNDAPNVLRRDFVDSVAFVRQWCRQLDEGEIDMWEEAEAIVQVQRALQAVGRPFSDEVLTP
ncbi:hypothetical protein C8J56DRAFT_144280 [Mycena floridula]|nr:hypothetical protein C8J56DRAFT_144280 [Mycena floridula]